MRNIRHFSEVWANKLWNNLFSKSYFNDCFFLFFPLQLTHSLSRIEELLVQLRAAVVGTLPTTHAHILGVDTGPGTDLHMRLLACPIPPPSPEMSSQLRPWDNKGHAGCFFTLWNTPGESFPGPGMLTMAVPSRARIAGLHDKTLLKAIPFTTAICLPWISCLSLPTYGEGVKQNHIVIWSHTPKEGLSFAQKLRILLVKHTTT